MHEPPAPDPRYEQPPEPAPSYVPPPQPVYEAPPPPEPVYEAPPIDVTPTVEWHEPTEAAPATLIRAVGRPTAVGRLVSLIVSVGLAIAIAIARIAFLVGLVLGKG